MKPMNYAEVDLSALAYNYHLIEKTAGNTPVMCVVKADAYGHGAIKCSQHLYDEGCRNFAVANIGEAVEIRPYVGESLILILGSTLAENAADLVKSNVTQNVYSIEYAKVLSENIPDGCTVNCHIKLETGMNRLGFSCDQKGISEIEQVCNLPKLHITGMFTHFARADEKDTCYAEKQYEKYDYVRRELEKRGIVFDVYHVSNSAAICHLPQYRLNMVRAGIILYGMKPSDEVKLTGAKPVMSLYSHLTHIHQIDSNDAVGYGGTYSPSGKITVGTVAIGYADGFVRAYNGVSRGNDVYMKVNGHKAKIIGRICMDQCMIDITGIDCKIGDAITVFDDTMTADELADRCGTIGYEVTCILTRRVKRLYK